MFVLGLNSRGPEEIECVRPCYVGNEGNHLLLIGFLIDVIVVPTCSTCSVKKFVDRKLTARNGAFHGYSLLGVCVYTWSARVGSEIHDRPSLILPLVRTIKIYNRIWTIYIIDRR